MLEAKTSSKVDDYLQRKYFLTGLPRTRTAWFSEFLPDCLHEGMSGCYSHKEYISKLVGGDSSCGLMYFPIRRYFHDAPIVIIERDFEDVVESLKAINLFNDNVLKELIEASHLLRKMNGLRVDYNNIDLEEIWNYLIGDGFDINRANEFSMRNIQKVNYKPDINAMVSFIGETLCLG